MATSSLLTHTAYAIYYAQQTAHISKNIKYHLRTDTWQTAVEHNSEIGRIRLPNSTNETTHFRPNNLDSTEPKIYSKKLGQKITDSIPLKPSILSI